MRRSQSLSSSSSGLRCFAALARASRLASRASLNWFLRRLLISRPFRRSNRGPCALSHGQPSSPTPCNLGDGLSCAGACPPAPYSRCRISPWPLRCSFRLVCFHQRLYSVVVLFSPSPQRGRKPLEVAAPLPAVLFASARVVSAYTLLPDFFGLVGIHVALPSPALDHGVELLLDHLRVLYIHQAPFVLSYVHISRLPLLYI